MYAHGCLSVRVLSLLKDLISDYFIKKNIHIQDIA